MNWKIVVLILVKVLETITHESFKNLLTETKELIHVVRLAIAKDSDGGRWITTQEMELILKEAEDVPSAAQAVVSFIARNS